jgi:hypothetical protein
MASAGRVAFGSYCADLEAHYRPLRGITGTAPSTWRPSSGSSCSGRPGPGALLRPREHGVGCIAGSPGQVVAPHPVLVFEVTDRGLHGRAPAGQC